MHNNFENRSNGACLVSSNYLPAALPGSLGFRLPLHLKQMGEETTCRHRSGWRYVMESLRAYHDPAGVLLDDFVERSFQHAYCRQEWREPWVGIFHHPPSLPAWLDETAPLEAIFATPEFRRSRDWLMGAVALSEHLGQWLEAQLDVPVLVLRHPTEIPEVCFSFDDFVQDPAVVQVGWYARNPRAIHQVAVPENYRKIHLLQRRPWVIAAIERTDTHSPYRDRPCRGKVEVIEELDNEGYDSLLSKTIVLNEYFAVSASNTIIETLARGAPSLVNRHPAVEEYMGRGYPLFFDHPDEPDMLLRDPARIADAAGWVAGLDRSWMDGREFARSIAEFMGSLR